ncbi:MAG: OmpA family protein [Candidatus Endonucleobacter bathymodioli]|uniref:Peptidoglycan-associated protein n=1 Tax=Candidatus Endonucleibacter bathymodioli TaxID=539814 RepID=A0AA90STL8_9GAMM|nr:OmpA family protein [Candidatus Endonucleobacter bathymodioli]
MQGATFLKVTAVAVTAIWLAGCASSNKQTADDEDVRGNSNNNYTHGTNAAVEITPVQDPSVQAVIDSGVINASPEQIEEMLDQHVYKFGYDSSELSVSDYTALDVHAAYLKSSEGLKRNLTIEGHTDERGTRTYNLALGERRANVVKNYLISKGVALERIEVISFGFEKPLDTSHDAISWSKNRRAVIVIQE